MIDTGIAMLKNNLAVRFGVTQQMESDPRETLEFIDPRCLREGCCQNTSIHPDFIDDRIHSSKMLENKSFMHEFIKSDHELTEEVYLVCPLLGLWLCAEESQMGKAGGKPCRGYKGARERFGVLVLPDGHKETLLAPVQTHSRGNNLEAGLDVGNRQMDLVRGKGKGLIILLHGEPGVGKSSTAESVAEFTRRPLFQVTCGDIGDSADEVEERLENHF